MRSTENLARPATNPPVTALVDPAPPGYTTWGESAGAGTSPSKPTLGIEDPDYAPTRVPRGADGRSRHFFFFGGGAPRGLSSTWIRSIPVLTP